jgi:hypothetical protein
MMTEDLYTPITNRLRELTRDLTNAVNSVLAVSATTKSLRKQRMEVDTELKEAINHLSKAFFNWRNMEEIFDYFLVHLDELDEVSLGKLVEKSADSEMALRFIGEHGRLKEVRTAHAMISLDEELIPYSVKEVGTHSRETLEKWGKAIEEFLKQ